MKSNIRHRLLVAASMALLILSGCDSDQEAALQQGGPTQVEVATLTRADVTLTTRLPGRTIALRTAEIRPQVNGIIVNRLFREGAEIDAGEQLYQIDDAPYKAALATAQAQLAQANANLAAAEARESRYRNLLDSKSISQQDYDDARASFLQAQAAMASANAAIETATINLEYTKVLAPISGRIGKSTITEGALVTAGQPQALAVIQQFDPIYVDVSQSVNQLLDIRRQMLQGNLLNDPDTHVKLALGDGSVYEHRGRLEFSEVDVNESTGTVVLRALFPNPDHLLLPGMYVRAEIVEGRRPDSILIPQRAVTHDREGQATTMVVNDQGVVERRTLQTGRSLGNSWLVLSGVEEGERVVVSGLQWIQPGAQVDAIPVAEAQPENTEAIQADRAAARAEDN